MEMTGIKSYLLTEPELVERLNLCNLSIDNVAIAMGDIGVYTPEQAKEIENSGVVYVIQEGKGKGKGFQVYLDKNLRLNAIQIDIDLFSN